MHCNRGSVCNCKKALCFGQKDWAHAAAHLTVIFIISPFFINIPLILVASVPQRFRWKIKNAMCCSPLSLKSSVKLLNSERHDYAKAGVSALMWLSKQLGCLWITRLQCCPLSMLTDWFNCVTVFGGLSALLFNTLLSMYEQLAGLLGLTWWQITRVYRGPEAWLERASLQMQGCVHLCACLCRHFETPKSAIASFRRDLLCKECDIKLIPFSPLSWYCHVGITAEIKNKDT